jgi:hypothetical protein
MAYLTIARITGDTDELLKGYRRSSKTMEDVGRDHGMLLHAAAGADDGLVIVNLWESEAGSESAAEDPRRNQEIERNGLKPSQFSREHHEVEDYFVG